MQLIALPHAGGYTVIVGNEAESKTTNIKISNVSAECTVLTCCLADRVEAE